ncbi:MULTISPECIES: potassium channel family protein [Fictibacillus]|jgi:voltage-gated potassium channel|uniref:potassium channel family protein n=1 Tax=Fictibacillus TaxID=1329200 RepID=UPI00102A15FA|nr:MULTISPECIES: potassium channel protein [Fictibacillus]RZT21988.1 voltage-gated potassium channel [Fictibacillus sp. BK138]
MYILQKFFKQLVVNKLGIFSFTFFIVIFSSIVMRLIEPETFPGWFDALWYVMTTVTTVGYGDFYPVSVAGRIYAIFIFLIGIGIAGLAIGKLVEALGAHRKRKEEGRLNFKGKGHFVIIGWSEKAKYAISEIIETHPEIDIVLIDQLNVTPITHKNVHYIQGDPSSESVLMQANINDAKSVLVFSDDSIQDSALADGKTLLVVTSVERLNQQIHSTVEIKKEENIKNFRHAKVDEFVLSHETVSRMAVRSAFSRGITEIYTQLLSYKEGENLFEVRKRGEWKTYKDAFEGLLMEGATLISDGSDLGINKKLNEPIREDARLYIICSKEVYESLT